jgi:hypothetical protein
MRYFVLAAVIVVAGCAPEPTQTPMPQLKWVRSDGRAADSGIHSALTECNGEAAKAAAHTPSPPSSDMLVIALAVRQRNDTMDAVLRACMQRHGYVLVPAN